MLGDDPYSVNDEGMKEGNTYQVNFFSEAYLKPFWRDPSRAFISS